MTPVTEKQIPRYARVPRAALGMTSRPFPFEKKREASAQVIPSAVGARDLLFWEHL